MINSLLSLLLSKIRGESSKIDSRITFRYLSAFAVRKSIAIARGAIIFKSFTKPCFVGANVRLRCKKMIFRSAAISVSDDCYIDALSIDGIRLGSNFSLGRGASIECTGSLREIGLGFTAGDNVGVGSFSFFGSAGGIKIGDETIIGNYVSMHSENHLFNDPSKPIRLQGVTRCGIEIGENCWIGAKATILDGVIIGNNCIVAAGAVVTKGVYENNSILAGNPARVISSTYK